VSVIGPHCSDLNRACTQINRWGRINNWCTSVQYRGFKKTPDRYLQQLVRKLRHVMWTSFWD